jgi:hypothetical protein
LDIEVIVTVKRLFGKYVDIQVDVDWQDIGFGQHSGSREDCDVDKISMINSLRRRCFWREDF